VEVGKIGRGVIENPKSPFKVEDADNFGEFPFFTSGDNILRHSCYLVDGENLFIATGGKAKVNYYHGKASYSTDTYSIKAKELNTKYLFYTLIKDIEKIDYNFFSGSGLKHLQKDDFKNILLTLPPLPEQRKIAQILETVDNAIEKTEKIIEKYKRIKQGLMQDLLTKGIDEKGNIRSEKTHKFKDSPLGRIPEEWEVKKIKEFVLKIIDNRGKTPPTSEEGIDLIETVCITDKNKKHPDFSKVRNYVSEDTYNKWFRSGHPKEKDILIAMVGENVGSVAIMNNLKGCIAQNLIALRLEENTYPEFLYYLLTSEYFQRQMFVVLMTAAQPSLKLPHLLNFIFPLPPLSEQKRIAEILSQIDQAIEKEEKYKQKLERLKKGLMEDLLTGKVRVNKLLEGKSHEMA
jgi:type I restriction enzyme S subunit